jgi:AraC-like DNA-binding protein
MSNRLKTLYYPNSILLAGVNRDLYAQYDPPHELASFIMKYWACPADSYHDATGLASQEFECIVPDGCVDIVFVIDKSTGEYSGSLFGPADKPFRVTMDYNRKALFGITFCPGGLYPFIKSPLDEIKNLRLEFSDAMTDRWKVFAHGIALSETTAERVSCSNNFFRSLLDENYINDTLDNILYAIYISCGGISINELSRSAAISERQMNRLFNRWIGISPKLFSRIVRFQNVIREAGCKSRINWAEIAAENGYFDESHLFNDFREFSGITPEKYHLNRRIMSDFSKT